MIEGNGGFVLLCPCGRQLQDGECLVCDPDDDIPFTSDEAAKQYMLSLLRPQR